MTITGQWRRALITALTILSLVSLQALAAPAANAADPAVCVDGSRKSAVAVGDADPVTEPEVRAAAGGVVRGAGRKLYAALGDSYSAGEGAPAPPLGGDGGAAFLAATDVDGNRCHRSTAGYGVQVWRSLGPDWGLDFAPCSGATTDDYWRNQDSLAPAQQSMLAGRQADLVTFTMGGNDTDGARPASATW